MYDKLKLFADTTIAGYDPAKIVGCLDDPKEEINPNTGELIATKGHLGNLSLYVYRQGVYVNGSISKYYLGDNIQTLTRKDVTRAFEKISDVLHLQILEARPTGLEFGTNLFLSNPASNYLQRLGEMPHFDRVSFSMGSLYYQHKGKSQPSKFVFYDKIADATEKGLEIPIGFDTANLLRYEMRLSRRIGHQTGFAGVTAQTLTTRDFYRQMVSMWGDHYFMIRKHTKINNTDMGQIKNVGNAIDLLLGRLIMANPEQASQYVNELKGAKVFADPKYYTRVKAKIKASMEIAEGASDPLLRELDDEVKTIVSNQ